ncbi:hypothetical protein BBAD15_g5804 [Beauveria bassiana D1-5]|uniref:MalT-like TPR region domain-containing protein n=1 Tax=Beauveria bassiana D1-5 TaxID=1245745 RepID=A0A0A2VR84_BEABA|nr:hypothetical protein BBAD15_g5804 [Beauveria bassiana D1-5]
MDPSDLERFFVDQWNRTVLQCEKQLESDDLERVRQIKSWDALQCDAPSNTPPCEISIIEPSLGHLRRFATLFGTELAVDLNLEFFWGILNLLLKVRLLDCPRWNFYNIRTDYCSRLGGPRRDTKNDQVLGLQSSMMSSLTQASAYFVKGTLERKTNRLEAAEASFIEAQNLWMRGDQTSLHPFHAGCIYKIGVTCLDQGKIEAAVKHLGEALTMTKFHANTMPAEHARCLFKLSEALLQDSYNDGDKAKDLRDDAEMYLLRRDAQVTEFGREDSYDLLVPIFWR